MFTKVKTKYSGDGFGELVSDNGLTANIYRSGERVFKVFNSDFDKSDVFREAYIMGCIERRGLASPKVYGVFSSGSHWVIEMDYVHGDTLLVEILRAIGEGDMAKVDALAAEMAEIQYAVNSEKAYGLPSFRSYIGGLIDGKTSLSESEKALLLARLEELPQGNSIVHGDYHPINILYQDNKPVVIDWLQSGAGNAACDVARTYMNLMYPPIPELQREGVELHRRYFAAYSAVSGMTLADIEPWFPVVAGMCVGGIDPVFSAHMRQYIK